MEGRVGKVSLPPKSRTMTKMLITRYAGRILIWAQPIDFEWLKIPPPRFVSPSSLPPPKKVNRVCYLSLDFVIIQTYQIGIFSFSSSFIQMKSCMS